MRWAVVVFPGTNCELDCRHVVADVLGQPVDFVWHKDTSLDGFDAVVLPGGFSYGDYLRTGAIARFSPIMGAVEEFAAAGRPVIGICNGFQILLEAGLLPGAMRRNDNLKFRCHDVHLRVENAATPFTNRCRPGQVLRIPIKHGEGNYHADRATLEELERNGRVVFRYVAPDGAVTPAANPNGSLNNIAGIINERGNVLGMMPHPEIAAERLLGMEDGRPIFESIVAYVEGTAGARWVPAAAARARSRETPGKGGAADGR
ncbi:MAG: phosphoribosylformylglycinamidine synthase subunit PurQ [Bacillota bacterium]